MFSAAPAIDERACAWTWASPGIEQVWSGAGGAPLPSPAVAREARGEREERRGCISLSLRPREGNPRVAECVRGWEPCAVRLPCAETGPQDWRLSDVCPVSAVRGGAVFSLGAVKVRSGVLSCDCSLAVEISK